MIEIANKIPFNIEEELYIINQQMKLHPFSRVWIFLCKALEPYTLLFCKKC